MEIKIQINEDLTQDEVIGSIVSEEDSEVIIGEIISYDALTGIAVCQLYDNQK